LLSEEFTSIDAFVTLSPLPEFRKWVETKVKQSVRSNPFNDENVVDEDSVNALVQANLLTKEDSTDNHKVLVRLLELVSSQKSQKEHHNTLSPILSKLMARYLVVEKHRKRPLDPVTRFHVGNGAEVWRVNFDADPSRKGMRSSFGCMVNYRYDLDAIEENQRNFELSHTVPVHEQVSKWISSKVKL
jgi:malonyl-CoA decarboxylase